MSESIIKRGRRGEYTVIQNSALRDKRLSLKTKGLFCIMISLPEDWTFSISGLASFVGVGKDAIRVSLRELQDTGYLLREQAHDDGGKFASTVYVLQENAPPLSENPTTVAPWLENPTTVKPSSENPTTVTYLNKQNKDLTKPPIIPQEDVGGGKKTTEKEILTAVAEYAGEDHALMTAILDFIGNRASIKKPVKTMATLNGILRNLSKLSKGDHAVQVAMLEEATVHNWQTVYALKPDKLAEIQRQPTEQEAWGWQ